MMTFFVRPIIRPPANLYKNDGGGGGGGARAALAKKVRVPPPWGSEIHQMKSLGAKIFTPRYFRNLCVPKNRKIAIFKDFVLLQL